jgi:hypothetical protein
MSFWMSCSAESFSFGKRLVPVCVLQLLTFSVFPGLKEIRSLGICPDGRRAGPSGNYVSHSTLYTEQRIDGAFEEKPPRIAPELDYTLKNGQ